MTTIGGANEHIAALREAQEVADANAQRQSRGLAGMAGLTEGLRSFGADLGGLALELERSRAEDEAMRAARAADPAIASDITRMPV